MQKISLFLTTLFIVVGNVLSAQTLKVTGTVTDKTDGSPVTGVSVKIQGASTGTVTDLDGNYSINTRASDVLEFSFIGMKTKLVTVGKATVINVILEQDITQLEDILVVAYGTAKKESFTGSAQIVKSDKITKRTVSDVTKALDGLAAGVLSTTGSGQPGAGASVVIRGYGSISAAIKPLYVVDGVPYDGAINAINPNDIESMTVIKDASAGALYGARGANGVVMITTKKGKEGKVSVNFKGNWGVSSRAIPSYETMNSYQWTEDVFYMFKNKLILEGMPTNLASAGAIQEMTTGSSKIFGDNLQYNPFNRAANDLIDLNTGKIYNGTTLKWDENWLDRSTASQPLRQEYQLTLTGGNQKTNYMFSAGYLNEEGLVRSTKFDRYSGRANIDSKVTDWFKSGFNVNFAANKTNSTSLGTTLGSSTSYSNVFYTCMLMAPIYPIYLKNTDGSNLLNEKGKKQYDWGEDRPAGASAGWNPLANLEDDKYEGITDNLSGRTYAELGGMESGILKGLKLIVNFGFDYKMAKSRTYYNPDYGNGKSLKGYLSINDGRTFSYTLNQILSWNRTFNTHHFDIMAGHELYKYNFQYLQGVKSGFPFGNLFELDAATTIQGASSYTDNYNIESYLSRFNYDFQNKYYFSASYRRDGTSRFNKDVRWGNFWSVGGSWRVSEEPFLKGFSWLTNLTLKASYGIQGNDNIGSLYAWQAFYSLAYPNGSFPGARITSLENTDLKWEKNENMNLGLETKLFNRLSVSAEYYKRYTKDMLMDYPMAVSLGFSDYSKNIGNMKNSGFELTISGNIIKKQNFNWNMSLMGSTIKNKVLNLADKPEIISGNYIIKEGETLNSFYLSHSAGVDPATGNKLYWVWEKDKNGKRGEKYISDDYAKALQCRDIAGSRIPKLYGSLANDFKIGNFDLSLLATYSLGGKILDGVYTGLLFNSYVGEAAHVDRAKAWKYPGDKASIPRIDLNGSAKITTTDDELINASYLAIKNITLGYTLPAKWTKASMLQGLRITLTADNLYLFSALKGMDPQFNFTGGTGYSYTPARTISLGLDLNF